MEDRKVYVCLADGSTFEGKSFGATGEITGELVFTTSCGGYIDTLTDASFYGQLVMQTFPLIGNYGFIDEDKQGEKPVLSAYIVREKCDKPSNFRCEKTLSEYLNENNIIGVWDVDTREITKHIRENGIMNAVITSNPATVDYDKLKAYKITDAVKEVSIKKPSMLPSEDHNFNVVLIDYGTKKYIIDELIARGCNVAVMPYDTKAKDILSLNPDGIVLSSGPSNPVDNADAVEEIKELVGKAPIFAVGLGHQLLALSQGAETERLKHGHIGANQPVKCLENARTYITSQNHTYIVNSDSVEKAGGKISYVNVNDNSCEGIEYEDKNAFSVQFYPEACTSVHATGYLFDKFTDMMGGKR